MSAYRLAIVDDEPSIRRGLSLMPWAEMGYEVAGLFPDGREAIEYMEKSAVDAVLTDIRMTHVSGIELAEWVHAHRPGVVVVILSGYSEFQYAQDAMRYRAVRYLLKPTDPDELRQVFSELRQALDEEGRLRRISRLMLEIDGARQAERQSAERQSAERMARQIEDGRADDLTVAAVERLLSQPEHLGASLSEIADALGMSASHLSRLFKQKTGENFSTFIVRHRVSQARRLLAETDQKVRDIGRAVGYWDVRHFIRVFSAQTGMSPTEYRRRRAPR
ncbi:MAG: helix-turn-helix domain-containing protein [Clostridiales bacterium]|nr:helix-turn-helix domain-containing protein [Clostridiales bacterium]